MPRFAYVDETQTVVEVRMSAVQRDGIDIVEIPEESPIWLGWTRRDDGAFEYRVPISDETGTTIVDHETVVEVV